MKEVANFSSKNTDSIYEIEVNSKVLKNNQEMADSFKEYLANIRLDKAHYVTSAINGLFKNYLPHPSERSLFFNPITEIDIKLKL